MNTNNATVDSIFNKILGPWEYEDKVILGIDVGINQSRVTFAYLSKGGEMRTQQVMSWPGQEMERQEIPTMVWYDANNKAVSFGAEAKSLEAEEHARDDQWQLARHFQLHLHPPDLRARLGLTILDPLPYNVPLSQIYADFIGYLLRHTQHFFKVRVADGVWIWETYSPTMDVIITHPNGWGINEQTLLRMATVHAGFTSEEEALSRIHFVTEAEALLLFCASHMALGSQIKLGDNFAICDVGESIAETTVYTVKQIQPSIRFEAKCNSAYIQAGAIFVKNSAKNHLERVLRAAGVSEYDIEELVWRGSKDFERNTMPRFQDSSQEQKVEIAGMRFNKPAFRIWCGWMNLPGSVVESFFAECVDKIISSVSSQLVSAAVPVSHIILSGGFGETPYLRERLNAQFSSSTCQVMVGADDGRSPDLAHGALIWYCANSVACRAPGYSFGVETVVPLMQDANDHCIISCPSGPHLAGGWSQIVTKDTPSEIDGVNRRPYRREYRTAIPNLSSITQDIYCYSFRESPKWIRDKPGALNPGFRRVGSIAIDADGLQGALKPEVSSTGVPYWSLSYSVCFRFAQTELQAFLEWAEDGVTRTSSASVVIRDVLLTHVSPNPQFFDAKQKFDEGLIVDLCVQECSRSVKPLPVQGDKQETPEQTITSDKSETNNLRNQLQQIRLKTAPPRTHLQIEESVKNGLVKQQLRSLNRQIEDLGRAISAYLASKHSKPSDTSLNAHNLDGLKDIFVHTSGNSSLVVSSSGEGMPAADFFEQAIRSILCKQLYLRIFQPFHPTIPSLSQAGSFAWDLYKSMQRHESQVVAGKWRKDTFNSITRSIGSTRMNAIKMEISDIIVSGDLSLLLGCFFDPFAGVALEQQHILSLQELVSAAWSWNEFLKGSVVLPGDFMPFAHRYGDAFDPSRMINFEGQLGKNPQYILSTIGLGVILTCANVEKEPETSTLYPALVTSDELFD